MSVIKLIFGHDHRLLDLLWASASAAKASPIQLAGLIDCLATGALDGGIAEISRSRGAHKQISNQITETLCRQFITPLDREDIEPLSDALYKISKTVEKTAERLVIIPSLQKLPTVRKQLGLLCRAAELVETMVSHLCSGFRGEAIKGEYALLQAIESEGDATMIELLRDLYKDDGDSQFVIAWKDVYDLLEKGVDRCRDAGFVVFHVALKNC